VVLGGYFTALQATEYINTHFTMSDSRYGAIFFIATGFHGTHVIIGAITLSVS
jgi:heme/copper-type cytochrome/quinol oxidase subunit 3